MKYSVEFIKNNTKFPAEDVQHALEAMDTHYSLITKLVGLYNVCGRKLPIEENVFEEEMVDARITIDMVCIASAYFKFAKKRDDKALEKYKERKKKLYTANCR